jgi:spore coat polysaccharide biosynthesis protein SpsF
MRIVAVTQARMGSTRFPGKVMKRIEGSSLLELHIRRTLRSKRIDQLVVATTINEEDAAIVEAANNCNVLSFRGSVNDVLDRFYQSLEGLQPDYVVRLTSDCPLIDAALIDRVIDYTVKQELEYCSNTFEARYPDGQDIEVFQYQALVKAWRDAKLPSEREHVTPYIWKNSTYKGGTLFTSDNFCEATNYGHLRMTVDEKADFEVITALVKELGVEKTWLEYANYLDKNNEIKDVNKGIGRNEGYNHSINKEK